MFGSKLYRLFNTLATNQRLMLRRFVQSPYHNKREDVRRLYEYLLDHYRQVEALEKPRIFAFIYPENDTYDDALLRQLYTQLRRTIEAFLIHEAIKNDPGTAQLLLAETYRRKKMDQNFQQITKRNARALEQSPQRDASYHERTYKLLREEYTFAAAKGRVVPLNLQKLNDALDLQFAAEKLKRACMTLAHRNVFSVDYTLELVPAILELCERKQWLHFPAIAVYYHAYRAFTESESMHFVALKQTIVNSTEQFSSEELQDIFLFAINYCIRRMNDGEEQYVAESFELYQLGLQLDIFVLEGFISRFTYKNIVSAGLRLEQYNWVEQFIFNYRDTLLPKYRDSNFNYNLAKLHFSRGHYEQAMASLRHVTYDDLFLQLDTRNMLAKIYYELKEFDALESLLDSLRTYLTRKRVIGYHRNNYRNFIRLMSKLIRYNPYSEHERAKLRIEMTEANPLTEREWLLRQLKN